MPYTHNRTAFRAVASNDQLPPLLRAYCGLVLIELALKERLALPNLGHDLPRMLQRLGLQNRPQAAALAKYRSSLCDKLTALHSSRNDNSIGRVRSLAYPDIRYIRHVDDWNADASNDDEVKALRLCVDQLRSFLKTNVGFAQPI
jgi:hypothetical protein